MSYHPSLKLKVYNYLESLRQSGEHNMFGVRPYVAAAFDVSKKEAGDLLAMYMEGTLVENVVKQ
jgi:hypothetical protein